MDDPMSIDLRKLKKPEHQMPPVTVATAPPSPPPPPARESIPQPAPQIQARPAPKFSPKPSRGFEFPWWSPYLVGALIVILLMWGGYYIYKNIWSRSHFGPTPEEISAAAAAQKAPSELSEAEIIARVAALMLLPEGETPALAKVSDPNALSQEAFFRNAKVGDIVVMYPKHSKAILYDPVTDKILEVAPIVTDAGTSTASNAPKNTP